MATATKAKKSDKTPQGPDHLHHLIPEDFLSEDYVSRKIEGLWDVDLLRYAKAAQNNVLLSGPTGPGKTSLVLAYAASEKLPLVTIQCNGAVDPNTFWGGLAFNDAGELEGWKHSEVTEVILHGGVLYMDEINFLQPKVAAVFHGLLDKRRQITIPERGNMVIKAHPDLQVIAAYNPDYEGTKPLNAAFKNRFKIKVRFDYDNAVEQQLVCIPVMLDLASKLRASHKAGDLDTPVSTNMLIEFEELAVDLSYEFAVSNFLNAFAEEERNAVKEVFDMFSTDIKRGVAEMEKIASQES